MPPSDSSPQAVNRYLTRILAALSKAAGGELRIKRKLLRQVEDETSRQVLLEDLDSRRDEIVLRFGSKHSAIYPVESEKASSERISQTTTSPISAQPNPSGQLQPQASPSPVSRTDTVNPRSSLPFTEEQLSRAERKISQLKNLAAIRREKPPAI